MILSVWLLLTLTGPISAHISTYAYTSQQACQAHAQGNQRCVEFRSLPLDDVAPPPPPAPGYGGAQASGQVSVPQAPGTP